MSRYLTRDELHVIRESLLVNKREIRNDANLQFTEKLDKYQKIPDFMYDEAISLLRTIEILYKDFDPEHKVVSIENGGVKVEDV